MAEFEEDDHPRAQDGKFTEGAAGESGSTAAARSATSTAVKLARQHDPQKPRAGDPSEQHQQHADSMHDVANAHVAAAEQHNAAAQKAIDAGDHKLAKEHVDAARLHIAEARDRNGEANEHAVLGGHDPEQREDSAHVAQGAHDAGMVANGHDDHATAHGEREKHGEHPGERLAKAGIAAWVAGKLGGLKHGVEEAGEKIREVEEKALTGDVYEAAADAAGEVGAAGKEVFAAGHEQLEPHGGAHAGHH